MRSRHWAAVAALAIVTTAAANSDAARRTQGALFIAGGGVTTRSMAAEFLRLAGGSTAARLVVIPTGLGPDALQEAPRIVAYWRSRGFRNITVLHARTRADANLRKTTAPLGNATAVWLSGGLQSRHAARYRGTAVERAIFAVRARGGVIGGSSAGAAVMSRVMIRSGTRFPRIGRGFDLLRNAIIDQHFIVRKRERRLRLALRRHPNRIGYGIDESAALVVQGKRLRVVGSGSVVVLTSHMQKGVRITLRPGASTTVRKLRGRATLAATKRVRELGRVTGPRGTVIVRGIGIGKRRGARLVAVARAVYGDVLDRFFAGKAARVSEPIEVLLFARTRHYRRFMRGALGQAPHTNNGMYLGWPKVALANMAWGVGNLRHEMVHGLIGDDFPRAPAWLNEGIGSLYGTVTASRRGLRFAVNYRLRSLSRALRRGRLPTLGTLARSNRDDVYGPRSPVFYATARYLLLYLDRQGKLGELYRAIRSERLTAANQLRVLQRFVDYAEFVRWVRGLRYRRVARRAAR